MEAEKKVAFETKKSNSRGVHLVYLLKHDDKLQNIVLFTILKTYFMTQTIPLFFNASVSVLFLVHPKWVSLSPLFPSFPLVPCPLTLVKQPKLELEQQPGLPQVLHQSVNL